MAKMAESLSPCGSLKTFICILLSLSMLTASYYFSGKNDVTKITNFRYGRPISKPDYVRIVHEHRYHEHLQLDQAESRPSPTTQIQDDTRKRSNIPLANLSFLQDNDASFALKRPNVLSRNQSKCSSTPNVGPIRRHTHIVTGTSAKSKCLVFGDGLVRASVGIEAKLTIQVDSSMNEAFHKKYFFSVLAVGEKHIFAVAPTNVSRTDTLEIHFSYIPTLPGIFDLYVEEMSRSSQKQLPGSPFKLFIDGPAVSDNERREESDKLPSCQSIQQYDPSWSEGDWVTRDLAGDERGTLRSGWVLQPKRCSFDIFTTDDLVRASMSSVPRTIVVLGRSTERGIFLSLVDLALRKTEKTSLQDSILWRCWGMEEVRVGSLRFIYQDFRIEGASMNEMNDNKHVNITCHNDKKVSANNDFFGDAIGYFKETLFTERIQPDVVIMVMLNALQLKLLAETIPESWNGTFYALNGFKAHEGSLYTPDGRQASMDEAKAFPTFHKSIRTLDGFALATPWRHTTEGAPFIMKSMHWHRQCSDMNGNVRVCGDPTEMIAQILLCKALAPDGKNVWLTSLEKCEPTNGNLDRKMTLCHDCPHSLFPWHIKRVPNLKCTTLTGLLPNIAKQDQQAWNGSLCPIDCMRTDPVGKYETQSGSVDVRICTILKV
ncbi:uncharacterized protein [Apostichopus japonicus]|uniref:uncharacterized protein n=1 Tax=Stichopus japonicus TaxID=307972 RepID=UPI003AB25644